MESKHDNDERPAAGEQALWDLLGRHQPVEVSPYFIRRVMRDLDADAPAAAAGWSAWLRPAWILGGSTAALAVVAGVFSFASLTGPTSHPLPATVDRPAALAAPAVVLAAPGRLDAPAVALVPDVPAAPTVAAVAAHDGGTAVTDLGEDVSPQDVDVIADLDNLVAREETSVWTDDTSRF